MLAKLTVAAVWAAATNAWLTIVVLLVGRALALPRGSRGVVVHGLDTAGLAAGLMLLATAPVALLASAGRGYLTPLSCTVAAVILGQVGAALGWAEVVPWSVPAVAAGLAPEATLGAPSIVILTATCGVLGTLKWWRSGPAG